MKAQEQARARLLRKQGFSVREITAKIGSAKGSVSRWVRGIPLTRQQIARLKSNQDRARAKAANHSNSPKLKWARLRQSIIDDALREIPGACSAEHGRLQQQRSRHDRIDDAFLPGNMRSA